MFQIRASEDTPLESSWLIYVTNYSNYTFSYDLPGRNDYAVLVNYNKDRYAFNREGPS